MALSAKKCEHIAAISDIKKPKTQACAECIKTGDTWVHLRTCQACGVTLCCDSSPNKHARKHANTEQHPVIISAERDEKWMWCYVDELFSKY